MIIPWILIAYTLLFIIGRVGQFDKYNKILERIFPWLALVLFLAYGFLRTHYEGVVTPEVGETIEDAANKVPIVEHFLNELVMWVFCLPVWICCRKKRKKNDMIKAAVRQNSVPERDDRLDDLPEKEEGRRKIVEKFNEKYTLNLTADQIKSIVDGSFLSVNWALEILAMDKKYASVSEWYAGSTGWLRAYLKAFNVQNVSADFEAQEEYCKQNFEEVFTSVDVNRFGNTLDYIEAINNTFMTNFDETSFMVAYRFLVKHGVNVKLPQTGLVRATNEIDALAKKYESMDVSTGEKLRG